MSSISNLNVYPLVQKRGESNANFQKRLKEYGESDEAFDKMLKHLRDIKSKANNHRIKNPFSPEVRNEILKENVNRLQMYNSPRKRTRGNQKGGNKTKRVKRKTRN